MRGNMLISLFAVVSMGVYVQGYPTGAPEGACDSMTPKHDSDPQTASSPYTISLASTSYTCGENITVTLGGTRPFKGFFCQARTTVGDSRVGTFDITGISAIKLLCNNQAVTHTNNTGKNSTTLRWMPTMDYGNVSIVCTRVEQKDTFWVKQASDTLTFQTGSTCGNAASHVTSGLLVTVIFDLACVLLF